MTGPLLSFEIVAQVGGEVLELLPVGDGGEMVLGATDKLAITSEKSSVEREREEVGPGDDGWVPKSKMEDWKGL